MQIHPKVVKLLERPQIEQRTTAWYTARRTLLTASDAASVLGIKPFMSYKGDIRDECMTKKLENRPFSNVFVRHGQRHEDAARDLMCEVLGETAIDFGLLKHPTLDWLGASPDGVCPISGRCIEMEVCDLDSCIFVQFLPAELNGGVRFIDIVVVERDRAWFAEHRDTMYAFWCEYMERSKTYVPLPPPPQPECLIVDDLYTT